MGNEVLYCAGCQTRLLASEFERRKAHKIDAQAFCAPCAKARFPERLKDDPKPPAVEAPKFSSSTRVTLQKPSTRRGPAPAGPPLGLIVGGAAGVLLLLVLIFAAGGSRKPVPPRPTADPDVAIAPPPPLRPEPPRPPPPPAPAAAQEDRRKTLATVETELASLDAEVAAELRRPDLGAAAARLQAARGRHEAPEWTLAIDRRLQDVAAQARQALQPILKEAVERRADEAAVRRLRERVAAWKMPSLLHELDAALQAAAPAPAPPPAPAAEPVHDALRRAALAPAAVREYGAAAAALEAALREVRDPAVQAAWTADVALLRKVEALHREAVQAAAQLPAGQALTVRVLDGRGGRQEIRGEVERVADGRLELSGQAVLLGELSASTLIDIHRLVRKSAVDAPVAAAFLQLDGEDAGDGRFREVARAPSDDAPARAAFEEAERLALDFTKALDAAAGLRALLAEHAGTDFVRRNRAALERRSEPPREFFFGPDRIRGGPAARPARIAKMGAVWVSRPGSEGALDLPFAAEAGSWRAWAYVGGCCAEALPFAWQLVDATEPATVKPQIYTSHRAHVAHGGVKEASRWGWVTLPLPAFPAPGPKTLRLIPGGEGFTLAHAVVSSARTGPPSAAEIRAWRKEAAEGPSPETETAKALADPTLVGWWRFEDGGGAVVRDATRNRNDGRVLGAQWVQGVAGGGLSFDGQDDAVVVAPSKSLDACVRGFTLAAWVFRAEPQQGWRVVAMRQRGSDYQDIWFLGFGDAPKLLAVAFAPDGRKSEVPGPDTPLRKWVHLAVTRDDEALRLYVDGTEAGKAERPVELAPEARPLTFGAGHNGPDDRLNEHWSGVLDEVRLYSRALGAAEVRALSAGNERAPQLR